MTGASYIWYILIHAHGFKSAKICLDSELFKFLVGTYVHIVQTTKRLVVTSAEPPSFAASSPLVWARAAEAPPPPPHGGNGPREEEGPAAELLRLSTA